MRGTKGVGLTRGHWGREWNIREKREMELDEQYGDIGWVSM